MFPITANSPLTVIFYFKKLIKSFEADAIVSQINRNIPLKLFKIRKTEKCTGNTELRILAIKSLKASVQEFPPPTTTAATTTPTTKPAGT